YKIKSQLLRYFCGIVELLQDPFNLSVRQQWIVARQSQLSIQYRMVVKNLWFGLAVLIRTAVSPGVRQLQSNDQPIIRSSRSAVLSDLCLPYFRQSLLRVSRDPQLMWIRAPLMRPSNRLASPDQLRAASSKLLPSLRRILSGISIL